MFKDIELWVEKSLSAWELLIKVLPKDHHARMPLGSWFFAYHIMGAEISPLSLEMIIQKARVAKTGWPPFWVPSRSDIRPVLNGDTLDCWLGKYGNLQDPAHSDFWRVNSKGEGFLLRGYQEDGRDVLPEYHGKVFDLTLPIWRLGEALLQANKMAEVLGNKKANIKYFVSWRGLKDRELTSIGNRRRIIHEGYICRKNEVSFKGRFHSGLEEKDLYKLITPAIKSLLWAFELNSFDPYLIKDETNLMLSNKFGNE